MLVGTHFWTNGQNQPAQSFNGCASAWDATVSAASPDVCGCKEVSTEPILAVAVNDLLERGSPIGTGEDCVLKDDRQRRVQCCGL